MKPNKVFLDTNILLDYILDRGPASVHTEHVFDLCVRGEIECSVAAHSIVNIFYILRKYYSVQARKTILDSLCDLCYIESIDEASIKIVLAGKHKDIEDHLQMLCAEKSGAECIITRDIKGFKESPVRIISPERFLKEWNEA